MGLSCESLEDNNPGRNLDNRDPVCEVSVGTRTLSGTRLETIHMIFFWLKNMASFCPCPQAPD